ncbi:MAG: baseplate J/gp47 family protein [Oscillospiraceae bacterium]|nr:baseplate J/gp47 family protein [Oscillospiraceae bacterium]
MSRNPEYQFVDTSVEPLVSLLVQGYERLTGETVQPASPERVFIEWVASIVTHERVLTNYTGNQNIPSRADGENLDALAELMYLPQRPQAQAARCVQRFHISAAQLSAVLVPAGTRVTSSGGLVWETMDDVYIPIGETYVDAAIRCQTLGAAGNGYTPGQLNTLVDLYDYCSETENRTTSDGGADEATDDEFYQLMRASMDAYSCAGARGGYEYFAKQVSTEIGDVIANSPTPGVVRLYVLMGDGTLATDEIKAAVLEACSADTVRPLTDQVFVEDAEAVGYNIDFTYYTQTGSGKSAAEIQAAVNAAVQEYVRWQDTKLGRDINPSTLIGLLMLTGIKRVDLREPVFTVLRDDNRSVPQVGQIGEITITDGGYEDE